MAALLLPLGLLAGCSGDDGAEPGTDGSPTGSADADKAGDTEEKRAECSAEVTVSGAVKASWKGDAFAVTENRSGPAIYKTSKKKFTLTLLAGDGDIPAVASLATKKGSFSGADGTLDVDPDGGGAEVDAELRGSGGKTANLVATITCK